MTITQEHTVAMLSLILHFLIKIAVILK